RLKKSRDDKWEETQNNVEHDNMLSYQQLNNQDLALITKYGIFVYTIVDDFLRLRYFWRNDVNNNYEWVDTFDIQKCLNDEFNDSRSSLPPPNFKSIFKNININDAEYKELIQYIINDPVELLKFGSEILRWA